MDSATPSILEAWKTFQRTMTELRRQQGEALMRFSKRLAERKVDEISRRLRHL